MEVAWTKFVNFIDQYPISLLIGGIVFILVGIFVNSSENRDSNLNFWIVLGIILFLVSLFKISGVSFISF